MKLTKENERILRKLGFKPDIERGFEQLSGWWSLDDGWGFRIDCMPSLKALVRRLLEYQED